MATTSPSTAPGTANNARSSSEKSGRGKNLAHQYERRRREGRRSGTRWRQNIAVQFSTLKDPTATTTSTVSSRKRKKDILCGQLLPVWTCADLWSEPAEAQKLVDITGIPEVATWMDAIKTDQLSSFSIWELRGVAEEILGGILDEDTALYWKQGSNGKGQSTLEGVAAAAAAWEEGERGEYLGALATVTDAELLRVLMSWEAGRSMVALDSQEAIGSLRGVRNEKADREAKATAWVGRKVLKPDIATATGIRQAFHSPLCGLRSRGVAKNAAHVLECPAVADGKGREWE
ncbi:hypothetical protein EV426DRAFT_710893 [Tirmania nivea]|nr:hypothetical protein EV426DRAFT_710893 [Tirmania nivea]